LKEPKAEHLTFIFTSHCKARYSGTFRVLWARKADVKGLSTHEQWKKFFDDHPRETLVFDLEKIPNAIPLKVPEEVGKDWDEDERLVGMTEAITTWKSNDVQDDSVLYTVLHKTTYSATRPSP